jgi:hypothetical protein
VGGHVCGSFPSPKKKRVLVHEKRAMPDEIPKKLIQIDAAWRERRKNLKQ